MYWSVWAKTHHLMNLASDFSVCTSTSRRKLLCGQTLFLRGYNDSEGCCRTYIEGLGARSMEATHDYLTQESPVEDSLLPSPRIFYADRTYRIPFKFVIPSQLLPHACQDRAIEQAHALHLQLPPSMNDTCSSDNSTGSDVFTPKMAKISYSVRAHVARREKEHGDAIIAEKERCVHVRPEGEEHPPVFVGPDDKDYRLSQEKTIRKALIGGTLGRLAVETYQPPPVFAGTQRHGEGYPTTSSATIRVRFDPVKTGIQPPKLESLRVALKATTFFSAKPWKHIPSLEQAPLNFNPRYFSKGLTLGSEPLGHVKWEKQVIGNNHSDVSSSQCSLKDLDPSHAPLSTEVLPTQLCGDISYTTQFSIPIQIPTRALVPTFHSCLVSRVYTLELTLVSNTSTSLSLKVPLQII